MSKRPAPFSISREVTLHTRSNRTRAARLLKTTPADGRFEWERRTKMPLLQVFDLFSAMLMDGVTFDGRSATAQPYRTSQAHRRKLSGLTLSDRQLLQEMAWGPARPKSDGLDEIALSIESSPTQLAADGAQVGTDPKDLPLPVLVHAVRILDRRRIVSAISASIDSPHELGALALFISRSDALVLSAPQDDDREALCLLESHIRRSLGSDIFPKSIIEIRTDRTIDYRQYLAGSFWADLPASVHNSDGFHRALLAAFQIRSVRKDIVFDRTFSDYRAIAIHTLSRRNLDVAQLLSIDRRDVTSVLSAPVSPPSERQIDYANALSARSGLELPAEAKMSAALCSQFIDRALKAIKSGDVVHGKRSTRDRQASHKAAARAPAHAGTTSTQRRKSGPTDDGDLDGRPAPQTLKPTEKQISFILSLTRDIPALNAYLETDWLRNRAIASEFLSVFAQPARTWREKLRARTLTLVALEREINEVWTGRPKATRGGRSSA